MVASIQKRHKSSIVLGITMAITLELIFAKMRIMIIIRILLIIPCPFLAKSLLCLLILGMPKLGHKYNK